MAWNEPNNNDKKDQDPWSGKKQSPPDLDEALKKFQQKIRKVIGGASKSGNSGSSDGGMLIGLVFVVLLVLWALSGIFIVGPAEQAVVLRFGKYVDTVGPGPHWIPPIIESRIVKNVENLSDYSYSAHMLTKDENIVSVSIAVQYRIGNLQNYLFNVSDPQESLQQATASALRQVVGHTTLDQIITEGREAWGQNVDELLRSILAQYKAGILISSVSPQPARAPQKVQDAFDDAIAAQEDEKRFKEKAFAYKERVVPIAEGNAKRIGQEAQAFSQQVVLKSQGDVAEFLDLLPEYKAAPEVTRERLYLDMMETVLSRSSKLLVEGQGANMLYLPLQKMLEQQGLKPKVLDLKPKDSVTTSTDESVSTTASRSSKSTLRSYLGRDSYRVGRDYR